jgi:hypothetical protein
MTLSSLVDSHGVTDSRNGICHIKPGEVPRFWFGSYATDRPPDLEGMALVKRIMRVLEIPADEVGMLEERGWVFKENKRGFWQAKNKKLGLETLANYHSGKLDCAQSAAYLERQNSNDPDNSELQSDETDGRLQPATVPAELEINAPLFPELISEQEPGVGSQPSPVAGQLPLFDYGQFDETTATLVRQRALEIKGLQKTAVDAIIGIGVKLIDVKKIIPHGAWGAWLESEFRWSHDTAGRFIRVANRYGQNQHLNQYAATALYELSAPSTPEEARIEADSRAARGESISPAKAKSIIEAHKPSRQASVLPGERGDSKNAETSQRAVKSDCMGEAAGAVAQKALMVDTGSSPDLVAPEPDASDEGWKSVKHVDDSIREEISAESKTWNESVIQWTTTLFKDDGSPMGRRVQIAITANGQMLVNKFFREKEVFDGQEATGWQRQVVLPKLIAVAFADAKAMLATRGAAEKKETAKTASRPAAKSKQAMKATVKKQAASTKSAPARSASRGKSPDSAQKGGK